MGLRKMCGYGWVWCWGWDWDEYGIEFGGLVGDITVGVECRKRMQMEQTLSIMDLKNLLKNTDIPIKLNKMADRKI